MSDIRSFFGGGAKKASTSTSSGSSLSDLKKAAIARQTASPPPAKKRGEKRTPAKNAKSSKDDDLVELGSSDDESPFPSSVRRGMEKAEKKRAKPAKRRVIDSDSDDAMPLVARAASSSLKSQSRRAPTASASPSPVKQRAKKSRVVVSSDDDMPPASAKKRGEKMRPKTPEKEESDEEMESATDSEDEFATKKVPKGKKALPPGQKTLSFSKTSEKEKEKTISASKLKQVDALDFFNNFGKSSAQIEKEKREREKRDKEKKAKESEKAAESKSTDVSPSQKENSKAGKNNSAAESPVKRREEKAQDPRRTEEKTKTPVKEKPVLAAALRRESPRKTAEPKTPAAFARPSAPARKPQPDTPMPMSMQSSSTVAASAAPAAPVSVPWVDKYRPKSLGQLVGQNGEKSPMNKLMAWLKDWPKWHTGEAAKQKRPRPAPWAAQNDGSFFKAVLLSGSPGIGKTTCAHMACELMGVNYVEMNASDVRNKKHLEAHVAQLSGSHQIEEFFGKKKDSSVQEVKHVLIMDEVDGMSGNEDRAGLSELIAIIKDSRIPIICICNDRQHQKMRSLVNYCFDVRFPRPRVEQLRGRIMSIACQEKIKLSKDEVDQLIEMSGHDVRQTIYNLQMRGAVGKAGEEQKIEKKDCAVNPFEAARTLLSAGGTLLDKQELFFSDYSLMPLFVQENYATLNNKKHTKAQSLANLRKASEMISMGDTVDKTIRSGGSWKLLNEQSMLSAALPCLTMDGYLSGMIQFPAWLGKNSTANKRQRMMRQLSQHAHLKISASPHSMVTDYVPMLRDRLTRPLIEQENAGVSSVVATMTAYDLVRDDAEAIAELAVWPGRKDPAAEIQSKTKAALTRALNKEHRLLPYAVEEIGKGAKKRTAEREVEVDEDGNLVERVGEGDEGEEEEEEDDKPAAAATAKAKAPKTPAARGGRGGARGGGAKRGRAAK